MWPILLGSALFGGLAQMASSNNEASQQRNNISAARRELSSMLIDENELNRMLLNNKRFYGSRLTNLMNTTALGAGKYANSGVVKAAAAAPTIAESLRTNADTEKSVLSYNNGIYKEMANLNLGIPANNMFGNFTAGALEGGGIGLSLMNMGKKTTSEMPNQVQPVQLENNNDENFWDAIAFRKW